jgi:hypothetical protein
MPAETMERETMGKKEKGKKEKGKGNGKGKPKGKNKGKPKPKDRLKPKKPKGKHGKHQPQGKKHKPAGKPKKKKLPLAEQADKYLLYQRSVQEPDADLEFVEDVYKAAYGRLPRVIREDFCAAANTACAWVRRHPENQAWGIDLDPEPLSWGKRHNASDLTPSQLSRLHLIEGNVLDPRDPKAEVILAQNFSYYIFKTRKLLRSYFEAVHRGLQDDGLFVLDMFGGPEAQTAQEEETDYEDERFSYVWDQDFYNPITNEILCYIHFNFPDGSRIDQAFTYDWRMWTIQEVRELLEEAGFSSSQAFWEGTDDDNEGNGEYTPEEKVANEDAWIAYVVGYK